MDVITPPETHLEMCRVAGEMGIHVICQKPLAPTFEDAQQIVAECPTSRHPLHGPREFPLPAVAS